ncbi:MAG: amidohydrolase [Synergistaceae bacterium]|jgi:predicted amidohydrolase YtcJ|nr:amidohydrolase [Synergistaceae bacterium]
MAKKSWLFGVIVALMFFVLMAGGCGEDEKEEADSIYINGNIYTVDDEFSKATAMAVRNDRILYVGDADTASQDYGGASTKIVDLGGKTVIPGIIENHLHFRSTGMMDRSITIDTNWQFKVTILANVKTEAEKIGPGNDKWIYSFGWNEESPYWGLDPATFKPLSEPPTPPTKKDLDDITLDNPVFLERTDGHSAWLNSKALELCGITKDTPDLSTSGTPWIEKDENGELTGIIRETVMSNAQAKVPLFGTDKGKLTMYKAAEEKFLSLGLTTVVDAGITYDDIVLLDDAYENGTLKVRAYEMLAAGEEKSVIKDYGKPVRNLYDGKFSVNAVKVYADGSLGSRTAWLLNEYTDAEGSSGSGIYTPEQLKAVVKAASDSGFQVATHAIGDRAVKEVIDAYEAALPSEQLPGRRFRIEHYSVVQPDDLARVVKLGIIPSIQGYFAPSDHTMAPERLGQERAALAYTWRTMIDKGAKLANGSDSPVEEVSPFRGIYAAVTRKTVGTTLQPPDPPEGWFPKEKITKEEALRSYTSWGALAIFEENDRGSLETGKYADFVVIDRDYMSCPDDELQSITVLQTYIGGELVYDKPASADSAKRFSARGLNTHQFQIKGECPECARLIGLAKARKEV